MTDSFGAGALFDAIFTTDALLQATSDGAWVEAMLEVEGALALSEGDCGVLEESTAAAVAECCRHARLDPAELGRAARRSGNPVVPLVRVLEEEAGPELAGFVHYGATSQDILDTAAMLVARRATGLILDELDRACGAAARLAEHHRETVLAARTLLQQAVPTTFGLKAAVWLTSFVESRTLLSRVRSTRLAVELGGAGGTLASLGDAGEAVTARFAERLGLVEPVLPWHTARGRVAELGAALGIAAGAAAKVARDVALLMQSEVAEASEPGGSSSSMPHKRNPAGAAEAIAAARQADANLGVLFAAMDQEHERSVGAWHAEWSALSGLLRLGGGAVARAGEVLAALEVDPSRMRANLDASHGLTSAEAATLAISAEIGKQAARRAVEEASERVRKSGRTLSEELRDDPVVADRLTDAALAALADPSAYLGSSARYIERALASYRAMALEGRRD